AMRPRLVVAGVLAALVGGVASAQELNLTNASADRPNIIELRTGFDHALVWELGYVRVIDLSGHRLFLSGELELPTASADFGDYPLRLGASTILLGEHARRWRLAGALSPTLRATSNALANMTSVGVDVRLTGGWYSEGGFVAAEAGLD